jgi:hypothetical protein
MAENGSGSAPATKADIHELRELIERVETNLLTEFHKWARTYEIRARGTSTVVFGFDERLGLLEERVSELERRRDR